MELYKVEKLDDGSVKVVTVLNPDEMKFMLEFALINLMAMGMVPRSVAQYIEDHKDEFEEAKQKAMLAAIPRDGMGEA